MKITVSAPARSATLEVPLVIVNQKPVINIYKKSNQVVSISIIEPDGDDFKEKSIKLFKDDKEFSTLQEGDIDVSRYTAGKYKIVVVATDWYGETNQQEYSFEIQETGGIQETNIPPKVKIVQPFQNESTPPSLVLRYVGTDENSGDILVYDVEIAKSGSSSTVLKIHKTKSTEIIIPNLERDTTYTATVTVYDLAGASDTAAVTFRTSARENYLYVNAKDFGGKGLLAILKTNDINKISTVGTLVFDDTIEDFDLVEDYIYLASDEKIIIVDSKDKAQPKIKDTLNLGSLISIVRIYKNYAIVGVGYDRIEVVDLTIPSSPSTFSSKGGTKVFSFKIPNVGSSKNNINNSGPKKDSINITQGHINDILLYGDKAFIAADLAGIWELDLSNLPNLTVYDVKNIIPGDYSTIDVGIVNNKPVLAFGEGQRAGIISISDTGLATKTTFGATFDTPVRKVKVHDGKVYILTMDKFYVWNGLTLTLIRSLRGTSLRDFHFLYDIDGDENCLLFDEVRGLWRFRKNESKPGGYELFEPNKIYFSKDHVQYDKFIFLIGDGFVGDGLDGEGLHAIDARDPKNYVERDKILGNFTKIKLNPYSSNPTISVLTQNKEVKLYEFDVANTLRFTEIAALNLSSFDEVYDFAIDSANNIYALLKNSTENIVAKFSYGSSGFNTTPDASYTLPVTVSQAIPYITPSPLENISPMNIEVVINNLSKQKETMAILVALGRAGSMKLLPNLSQAQLIFSRFYVVTQDENGYTLKKYNPGYDQRIIADKYFDRIYIADGEYNGVWLLDKNGVNLLDTDDDNMTSTPLFEGAPARNISWYGDKLFVAGGGFGYKIINVYQKAKVAEVNFSGLTYAFNLTTTDDKYIFVSTDSGLIVYDISNISDIKPLFTLSMPMFKAIGR
uniref:Fibronectin type-III domain-containing protein n=1 Tax=Fervidobacterium pennivorans TaxID=93466 RepID=A0A7V4NFT3_FERPE